MLTVSILLDSVEKVQRFVSKISRYSCSLMSKAAIALWMENLL